MVHLPATRPWAISHDTPRQHALLRHACNLPRTRELTSVTHPDGGRCDVISWSYDDNGGGCRAQHRRRRCCVGAQRRQQWRRDRRGRRERWRQHQRARAERVGIDRRRLVRQHGRRPRQRPGVGRQCGLSPGGSRRFPQQPHLHKRPDQRRPRPVQLPRSRPRSVCVGRPLP